jgi:16S rRNA (guanine(966)-N(2))-methyltransferase RsmD
MRVIGGKAKGHRLTSPKGQDVRPTSDRVREAIFSSLQRDVPDAVILDLFAGAGTLGIEALSRYAQRAYFVDRSAVQIKLIKENLEKTYLAHQAILICLDAETAIRHLAGKGIQVGIVFMDPPYAAGLIVQTLEQLDAAKILQPDGIAVIEFSIEEELPKQIGGIRQTDVKRYGSTGVAYYRRTEET